MSAIACDDINFESEALQAKIPVLVDFWAPWCGPCRALGPIVDDIAREYEGRLKVVKVEVGGAPHAAARFGVSAIPNVVVIDKGEVKAQLSGLRSKQVLVDALKPYLNGPEHAAASEPRPGRLA